MIDRPAGRPGHLPPGIEAIQGELASREWESLEEAQAYLERKTREYNEAPQEELGGLSPAEAHALLVGDWESEGPLRLADDLALDELASAPLLVNARTVLAAGAEGKGIKATTAGNLSRKFVGEMLERTRWPDVTPEEIREYNKVVNEQDFWHLHILRVLLGLAGLLRRQKGFFRTTHRGRGLQQEHAAGALMAHLFRIFFRKLNLAYLSRYQDEDPDLQHTVAFTLYRLPLTAEEWRDAEDLVPLVLLPVAHMPRPTPFGDPAGTELHVRVLRPLEWFGLLERRDLPGEIPILPRHEYRKTPLFDRFVRFPPGFGERS